MTPRATEQDHALYPDAVPAGHPPSWQPKELGLPRATLLAIVLVALIGGFCFYVSEVMTPPHQPEVIQVTQAQLVQLPTPKPPPPPPPPKVIPPPKPLPAVIPKPPPIPSKIVVATKPPPPVHHIYKPVHHIVPHVETPTPPVPQPPKPTPPQPQVERTDGEPAYGAQMHAILEANQDVPPALAQLGASGTALIRIEVAPDGHVVSAVVARSSGISLIDQTALDHVREATFPPFNADMPGQTVTFLIPIEIDGENASQ
jgi:protein TonB